MLLLILLFQHTTAGDIQATHIIKNVTSCPDVGYFFHRDIVLNAIEPGPCLLCFCKENSSAICWKRDASRCDQKNYRHYGKRHTRFRRSPAFSDIFFRDAARDVLDKRTPEQCKPYESSFSEGCPPADWCIGCTVCDCDANGRWDCHILSFCPDKKGKKQVQKKKSFMRNKLAKRSNNNTFKTTIQTTTKKKPSTKAKQIVRNTKPLKKSTKTAFKKPSEKRSPTMKKGNVKTMQSQKRPLFNKSTRKMKKTATTRATKTKFIKKKPATVQQAKRKAYKTALQNVKQKNDTYKLAEAIVKRVMSNVEKYMNENQKKMNKPKVIQKRSMPKHYNDKKKQKGSLNSKKNKTMKKLNKKTWDKKVSLKKQTTNPKQNKREKRSIDSTETVNSTSVDTTTVKIIWENKTNFEVTNYSAPTTSALTIEYYKYDIHAPNSTKIPNNNHTIYIDNETDKEVNKSSHNTVKNEIDNNISTKPLAEINDTFKDFIIGNIKNDKWKDFNTLLSKEYKKRIQYEKYYGSTFRYNNIVDNKIKKNSCGKVCSFKSKLKKLIFGLHPYEKERIGVKVEKINLLKSLKNVFDPLFTKKQIKTKKFVHNRKHKNVLNALCKKLNLCHVDLNNKLLQSKLSDLNHETQNILKIVSSIRGLLYLLNNSTESKLKNEVEKLDFILRRYYRMDNNQNNMTETEINQIKYVKENTQEFVKSLERFALTLNDIIRILEKQSRTFKFSDKSAHRYMRCTKPLRRNKNETIDDKITRLKKLLLSYNLVQNKFMSKMYDALVNLQKNTDATSPAVSDKRIFLNKSVEFENYSRNIIENLRKLKVLGQKLNSNGRYKREVMGDEDAIEYLLVLMEYLLKQNKPVTYTPVSDGIDLLIEAIKNAPDIKPLKFSNKVTTPETIPTRTTESLEIISYNKAGNKVINDSDYSYKQIDSFDKTIYNDNIFKNKLNIIEKHATPSYDSNDKESRLEKSVERIIPEVTEAIFPVYINKKDSETYSKDETIEKKIIKHKFEVYNADGEDEDDTFDTITKRGNRNTEEPIFKANVDIEKEHEKLLNRIHYDIITSKTDINEKKDTEKISKLDWGDIKVDSDLTSAVEITTRVVSVADTTVKPQIATRTMRRYKDKYANPVSGISSEEIVDSNPKRKIDSKSNKIDIFNSFDYNTEKTDVDSDSKEDKNDAFSDFV